MRTLLSSFALSLLLLPTVPAYAWETRIGDPFYGGGAMRVVFDPAGNVVAGGYTHQSGDLAIATVAKLAPDGAVLWRTDVDPLGSFIQSVYADAAGDVIVQGYAGGTDEDSYGHPTVVKLDGATGVERWRHVGLDEDVASSVVDAAGNAFLSLERYVVGPTLDETRTLCRKLSGADGSLLWENPDCGRVGAVDAAGNVFTTASDFTTATATIRKISGADGHRIWDSPSGVTAIFRNRRPLITVDDGGNVICARSREVTKLAGTNGALLWQRTIAKLDGIIGSLMDVTTDNNDVVIAGASAYVPNKGNRLFVAKLSAVQGNQKWRKLVDAKNRDYRTAIDIAQAVAVDGEGNVVLTGELDRGFGRGRLVVMKLTGGGRILWARYPDSQGGSLAGGGLARAIAVGPGDTIAVGGALVPPEGVEAGPFYVGRFTASGDH
jgi:hypothetical protein